MTNDKCQMTTPRGSFGFGHLSFVICHFSRGSRMPLLGAHMSIAGGLHNALLAAHAHGMETVQLFTAAPAQWQVRPSGEGAGWAAPDLDPEAVGLFRRTLRRTRLRLPIVHDSYLINLAAPEPRAFRRSVEAF